MPSGQEITPSVIETLKDIYDLPENYKQRAIDLIKINGKTPRESYSLVMEDDDKFDLKNRRRNKLRKRMGLI